MKPFRVSVLASLVAAAAAACGSAGHPAAGQSAGALSSSAGPQAADHELAFVTGLASSAHAIDPQVVAGPVMTAYIRYQQEMGAADAATGGPDAMETVSSVAGGYRLCDGSDCHNFTHFTTNTAGQITGVSVNGEPVAGRMGIGTSRSTPSLDVSDVLAYRLTGTQAVQVVFKIHDVSYQPVNSGNGAAVVQAAFTNSSGLVSADSDSSLPVSLTPGETVYGAATFLTGDMKGTFELMSNDSSNRQLASSTVTRI